MFGWQIHFVGVWATMRYKARAQIGDSDSIERLAGVHLNAGSKNPTFTVKGFESSGDSTRKGKIRIRGKI
jgi:hypothetical protein